MTEKRPRKAVLADALRFIAAEGEFWTEGHRQVARQAAEYLETPLANEFRIIDSYSEPFTKPPVPGALQRSVTVHDVRSVGDPSELLFREAWYEHGTNHRVVKGCICRDCGEKLEWFVEISDIMAFVREHGPCTLGVDFFDQPWIRIQALTGDDD